jgi:hypothetical protein
MKPILITAVMTMMTAISNVRQNTTINQDYNKYKGGGGNGGGWWYKVERW